MLDLQAWQASPNKGNRLCSDSVLRSSPATNNVPAPADGRWRRMCQVLHLKQHAHASSVQPDALAVGQAQHAAVVKDYEGAVRMTVRVGKREGRGRSLD
jgi:hypothetical protein